MKRRFLIPILVLLSPALALAAGARIAILGDSITFDERWPVGLESALRAMPEYADADIVNLALPSETVSGLSEPSHLVDHGYPRPVLRERLARVLSGYKPTLVIACYGMNDGIYLPPDETRAQAFREGMIQLHDTVARFGSRLVILTPPPFKPGRKNIPKGDYAEVLDGYVEWLNSRRADGWEVVDIRPGVMDSIAKQQAVDPKFIYAAEGIHPDDAGYRFIADAAYRGLMPLLKLTGEPRYATGAAFEKLKQRHKLLKHAWLNATGFLYVHRYVSPEDTFAIVEQKAPGLLAEYRALVAARGKVSSWNGYERLDFAVEGRAALVVEPKFAAPGTPWIWRTEFFGHEPQADIALLGRGFHVGYLDMRNLYGAPVAIAAMEKFHAYAVREYGLSSKPVMEGFSRGGLYAFNWAAAHPDKAAALYVDAPVCDFRSWPGGKGNGPGSKDDWAALLNVYGFKDEAAALAYKFNPVDNLAPLAKAKIPILAVVGDADEVVPLPENIGVVEPRYKALGGEITVIHKPGGHHHPHSLKDPAPIVDFAMRAVAAKP